MCTNNLDSYFTKTNRASFWNTLVVETVENIAIGEASNELLAVAILSDQSVYKHYVQLGGSQWG